MSLILLFALFLSVIRQVCCTPIDNGILGTPIIECGSDAIRFRIRTQKPFAGRLFVRGFSHMDGCHVDGCHVDGNVHGTSTEAGIEIPFDSKCRVDRERSANPRGVYVSSTVVVSFHPLFLTKVDRAYKIRCIYYEADKRVNANLDVAELPANFKTETVPMPVCRYELLDGGPTGAPVAYATIGSSVYHKWTCESKVDNAFCMLVHSCTVEDGFGQIVDILDNEGCAIDRFLLNNLEYASDLTAGQETHVYKYADRDTLFFQCQISLTAKEPDSLCYRPECRDPKRSSDHPPVVLREQLDVRAPRSADDNATAAEGIVHSMIAEFEVIDVSTELKPIEDFAGDFARQKAAGNVEVCISPFWLILAGVWMGGYVLVTLISLAVFLLRCRRRRTYHVN